MQVETWQPWGHALKESPLTLPFPVADHLFLPLSDLQEGHRHGCHFSHCADGKTKDCTEKGSILRSGSVRDPDEENKLTDRRPCLLLSRLLSL